ncbi:hypothetical protein L873DRAFT_1230902 [Choiromyces venosus 120613-1]|uniref:Glycine zipper domain-containing protein n=1 Tax=Choiromyces venosus 120613-1 TaxID=1336337 RepID=A0A3N4JJ93_9PEZI|nr:hypothetical protein L873DRAFT_1230902 [Choiromyces venosus 120613-1]
MFLRTLTKLVQFGSISGCSGALPFVSIAISAICVAVAEDKLDELATQICSLIFGLSGAAIGSWIGTLGGPVGMLIGGMVGGIVAGFLGEWAYRWLKKLLLEKGVDGVSPIDRIADAVREKVDVFYSYFSGGGDGGFKGGCARGY